MFKVATPLNQRQQSEAKCGEIFCQNFTDLTICCCFCNVKLYALEDFLLHLQNNHFENNTPKAAKIIQEYDKDRVFDEDELLDEQWLENFKDTEELEDSSYFEENSNFEDNSNLEENTIDNENSNDMENFELISNKETNELICEVKIDIEQNSEEYLNICTSKNFDLEIETYMESTENDDHNNEFSQKEDKQFTKKKKMITCPECEQTFNLIWLLDDHIIDIHGGHKCTICSKRFGKRHHLTRHKLTHNRDRIYSCPIPNCGKTFAVLEYCKNHIEKHNSERKYACPVPECGKAFAVLKYFRRHLTKHNGIDTESICNIKHTAPLEKRYICDQCGSSFTTFFQMNTHQRLHTGEKPFQCNFCEKRYISKSSLNNHMITHKTERNCICNICQASFKSNKSLKRHQYIHMEDRNFKCELCNAAFKQPHGLLQHIQYVHKGKKDVRVRRKRNKETV